MDAHDKTIHKIVGTKLSTVVSDSKLARSLASTFEQLILPQPDAQTVFEGQNKTWKIEAYYPDRTTANKAHRQLADAFGSSTPNFEITDVNEENWVAISQTALPPVFQGRFRIYGNHDRDKLTRGPFAIEIDAGEAFGTAHHATTSGCLDALDQLTRHHNFTKVLDLGCGSGLLAIAVHRCLPQAKVIATDIDPKAIEVAKSNIALNRAKQHIQTLLANGLDHPQLRQRAKYDLIIANILASPLKKLAPTIANASRHQGLLILSGLLNHETAQVIATYRAAGFYMLSHRRNAGWSTLILKRCRPKKAVP